MHPYNVFAVTSLIFLVPLLARTLPSAIPGSFLTYAV